MLVINRKRFFLVLKVNKVDFYIALIFYTHVKFLLFFNILNLNKSIIVLSALFPITLLLDSSIVFNNKISGAARLLKP